jgi:ABC-2 type transport system ATP-binding protein
MNINSNHLEKYDSSHLSFGGAGEGLSFSPPLEGLGEANQKVITVRNLVKKFGSFVANDHLNFEVYQGEIFGFLGANGAGKTTAMKILCGLSSPTSGEVNVAGFDIYRETEKIKRNIGYMSQKFSLYEDMTIAENIRFFSGIYGISPADRKIKQDALLRDLGLESSKDALIGSLPLGWKQKLAFSVAIFHDPKIVFLDEPTGGVDPITRRKFWDLIYDAADRGITVFVTTHYMDEAEYCNRVSIMNAGRIEALDTPENLKKQYGAKNMDEVFVKIARNVE